MRTGYKHNHHTRLCCCFCYNILMKLSTILIAIISILAGAWVLNLIYHFSAWLSSLLTYLIAFVIVGGIVSIYMKSRKRSKRKNSKKSEDK